MAHPEPRMMWAVVCEKLHKAYGPSSSRMDAERFSAAINKSSQEHSAEQGGDPCTYRVIPIIVQQVIPDEPEGTVEYDKDSDKRKAKMN